MIYLKKKNSLLDSNKIEDTTLNNNFINREQKIENLPQTSLRLKGNTHSIVHVLKRIEMKDSYDEIIEAALNNYIESKYNDEKQKQIKEYVNTENEYKRRKQRKKENDRA